MRGWKFVYLDSKLRKIEAPSGQSLNFTYSLGKLTSVEQHGKAFVELKYSEEGNLSAIYINGVKNNIAFAPCLDNIADYFDDLFAGDIDYDAGK